MIVTKAKIAPILARLGELAQKSETSELTDADRAEIESLLPAVRTLRKGHEIAPRLLADLESQPKWALERLQSSKVGPAPSRWIMAIAFLLYGILGTVGGYAMHVEGSVSNSWPAVEGKVVGHEQSSVIRDDRRIHWAEVVYSYEYEGEAYESKRMRVGRRAFSSRYKSEVDEGLKTYPVGRSVTVYVNPDRPQEALLERGVNASVYGYLATGILAFLVAIAIAVVTYRRFRWPPPGPQLVETMPGVQ